MALFDLPAQGTPLFSGSQMTSGEGVPGVSPEVTTTTPGMNPMNFVSMAGMIAGALAPKDSWQARLGGVAAQQAQSQLMANAQLKRDNDYRKFLTEALKFHSPAEIGALAQSQVGNHGYFSSANGVGNPYEAPAKGLDGGGK